MAFRWNRPVSGVNEYAADLAGRIQSAWTKCDFRREAFADIAAACLAASPPHNYFDFEALLKRILSDDLPFQQYFGSPFGEPSVTLYWNSRFYIEALHWASLTPAIHNHTFHGAFTVLHGSSLHSEYQFHVREAWTEALHLGQIETLLCERLVVGDLKVIRPGKAFIHSVFHLDAPSVTIVARTHSEPNRADRFEYLPPGLAIDRNVENQAQQRKLELLALLARTREGMYLKCALELLTSVDIFFAFLILRHAIVVLPMRDSVVEPLIAAFRSRWSDATDLVVKSLREAKRRSAAISLRKNMMEPEQRQFLGVLLAHYSWPGVREAVSTHWRGQRLESVIARLVSELNTSGVEIDADLNAQLHRWFGDESLINLPRECANLPIAARETLTRLAKLPQFASMFR